LLVHREESNYCSVFVSITDYKGVVSSQADGQEPDGFALVPERRQFRSFVQNFCKRCCVREQSCRRPKRSDVDWKGACLQCKLQ